MVVKSSAVVEGETNFDATQCDERREDESTAINRMLIGRGGIATSGRRWHECNSGRLCPQSSSSCSNTARSDSIDARRSLYLDTASRDGAGDGCVHREGRGGKGEGARGCPSGTLDF